MKYEKGMVIAWVKSLSGEEHVQLSEGYAPPTAEQVEQLREKYGLLSDIICW